MRNGNAPRKRELIRTQTSNHTALAENEKAVRRRPRVIANSANTYGKEGITYGKGTL